MTHRDIDMSESHLRFQLPANSLFTTADKVAVNTALRHQFLVCAALDDLSLIHHKDLIGMALMHQTVSTQISA